MTFLNFTITIFEIAGIFGFLLYVLNYALLSSRLISGDCIVYYALNAIAASFVLLGLVGSFNPAAALTQGFWLVMSAIAISLRMLRPA